LATIRKAYASLGDQLESAIIEARAANEKRGRIYTAEIPDDHEMLAWDKTLSNQSESVKKFVLDFTWARPAMTGEEFYRSLAATHIERIAQAEGVSPMSMRPAAFKSRGEKAASDELRAAGIPGIRYLAGEARGKGEGVHNYVIFDDSRVKIQSYEQDEQARITIGLNRTLDISLFEKADRSSFIHETGHAFLEIMQDLAARPDAPQSIKDDLATLRTWTGNDGVDFTDAQHEQIARGFEAYTMEGKAPSAALRHAFASFLSWLTRLYKQVARLNVTLSPEVRSVFDRILATDTAIARAREDLALVPPWKNADEAGMTPEQYATYQEAVAYRTNIAADRARAIELHALFQAESQERAAERAEVEAQQTTAVDARPDMQALQALQHGVWPAGSPHAEAAPKLSKEDLERHYEPAVIASLPGPQRKGKDPKANRGPHVYTATPGQGLTLAEAAAIFSFPDGHALVEALRAAPDREALITQQVDAEMATRYPDPLVDGSLDILAKVELAEQWAGHILADEVKRLGAKAKSSDQAAPTQVLREAARTVIGRTPVTDIRPEVYARQAATASREAFEAAAKSRDGTPETQARYDRDAFLAKQRQMLNLHLYRAARDAVEASAKGQEYVSKFDDLATRKRIGKAGGWEWTVLDANGAFASVHGSSEAARAASAAIGGSYDRTSGHLEQIDALLERYELRTVPNSVLLRRERLKDFIRRSAEAGQDITIPDAVINATQRVNWRQLTPDAQREVLDAVKAVETAARLKNKLLKSKGQRDLDEVARILAGEEAKDGEEAKAGSLQTSARGKVVIERDPGETSIDKAKNTASEFFSSQIADSFLARRMDGGQDAGPVHQAFIQPRNEAADEGGRRVAMSAQVLDGLFRAWGRKRGLLRQDIPGTKVMLTNEQRISVGLNWGNAEGRQRVLAYLARKGGTEADARAIIESLDARDHDLMRGLWAHVDSFWSEIKDLEQRVTGTAPDKVEAVPFMSGGVILPGGYWPLKYDETRSLRVEDLTQQTEMAQMRTAAYGRAQTRHGHTQARVLEAAGLALRLDFDVAGQHVAEVIHDLTHREMLIDQGKLLHHPKIVGAMQKYYGQPAVKQLLRTAVDIAVGERVGGDVVERLARGLRKNLPAATFAYNITNAALNVTGLFQAVPRVGLARMAWAVTRMGRNAATMKGMDEEVRGKSEMMRQRAALRWKSMMEATESVDATGPMRAFLRFGMIFQEKTQQFTDTATWIAAHEKGLATARRKGMSEADAETHAREVANQDVIDTQASSRMGDRAAFLRGGELSRLFTGFITYFNRAYNLQVETLRGASRGDHTWMQAAMDTLMLWTVPATVSLLLTEALRGDDHDEEKDPLWKRLAKAQAAYGMGMLLGVREMSGSLDGNFGYGGPVGTRGLGVLYQLSTQVRQGEADKGLVKALIATGGLLGLPSVAINRLVDGIQMAADEGDALAAARAALVGKPRK
jgi:hypothetical protein